MRYSFFILLILLLSGCYRWKKDDELKVLVPELKEFQKIVSDSVSKLLSKNLEIIERTKDYGFEIGIDDEYRWIVESNFKRLFGFINEKKRKEIFNLFISKKIVKIDIQSKDVIFFRILPDYNNNLLIPSWEVLYVVYDRSNNRSYKRINETIVSDDKILQLEENWYRVVVTEKRYIGM